MQHGTTDNIELRTALSEGEIPKVSMCLIDY